MLVDLQAVDLKSSEDFCSPGVKVNIHFKDTRIQFPEVLVFITKITTVVLLSDLQ